VEEPEADRLLQLRVAVDLHVRGIPEVVKVSVQCSGTPSVAGLGWADRILVGAPGRAERSREQCCSQAMAGTTGAAAAGWALVFAAAARPRLPTRSRPAPQRLPR